MRRFLEPAVQITIVFAVLFVALSIRSDPQPQPSPQPTSSSASASADVATTAPAASAPGSPGPSDPIGLPDPGLAGPSATPASRGTPAPTPSARSGVTAPLVAVKGWATYDGFAGAGLAAGPMVRGLIGSGWRGASVTVCGPIKPCRLARIVDFCACGDRHGIPTLADLGPILWREVCAKPPGLCTVAIGR